MKYIIFLMMIISTSAFTNESISTNLKPNKNIIPSSRNLKYKKTSGHNMASNTYLLDAGSCAAGPYSAICGVSPYLTIGTITWLMWDYNSYNFIARSAYPINKNSTIGAQVIYIKSDENLNPSEFYIYQMETLRSQAIFTTEHNNTVTTHINFIYEYFFEETFAHSLRRNPLNNQPYQFTLSSLWEFEVNDQTILQTELGAHGLNYKYPQLLIGFSYGYKFKNSYLQIGISMNGTPYSILGASERIDTQTGVYANNKGRGLDGTDQSIQMKADFDMHPEIQYQYFF